MLLAKNFLSKSSYEQAKSRGFKKFLYNEIDFIPPESKDEVFFNCTRHRVESTWLTWEENERVIEKFKSRFPQFFLMNGYDLTLSIKKAMFWSNFKTGFLWYTRKLEFKNIESFEIEPLHKAGKISTLIKYARILKSRFQSERIERTNDKDCQKKIIHIKNNFQLGLYQNILTDILDYKDFEVFVDHKVDKNLYAHFDFKNFKVIPPITDSFRFPTVNFLKFDNEEWFVFNIIISHWKEICETYNTAYHIMQSCPKTLLINEAENGIYGALLSEIMVKNGVKVYNTMNGIKSGEAQDAFVNFSKWFIWDPQMKKLLMEKNNLSDEMLIISGHLIEDLVRDYKYQNSLPITKEQLVGKKVISLFSVRGKRFVKLETLNFLFDLIQENDSYFLMLRPHPSEKAEDYLLPEKVTNDNFYFVEYNSKNQNDTLHDQLLISDLSIVFGSTVSLDSKWMGIPCITYERREDSLVYCVDDEWIFHVKSKEEMKKKMEELLSRPKQVSISRKTKVSKFILDEIEKN